MPHATHMMITQRFVVGHAMFTEFSDQVFIVARDRVGKSFDNNIFIPRKSFKIIWGSRSSLKYESIQESSQLILPIAHIIKTELIALGTGNNKLDKKRDKSIVSVLLSFDLKIMKPKEENELIHCQSCNEPQNYDFEFIF